MATDTATHGWWIDGEYVPCECTKCQFDREEERERLDYWRQESRNAVLSEENRAVAYWARVNVCDPDDPYRNED